jgi:hypothetical protein
MFRIDMLPAEYGDCLWVEYGDKNKPYRILIDGGTESTYAGLSDRIKALNENDRKFELLVITHVDADHIGGILKLIDSATGLKATFGDVWFNGFRHLLGSGLEEFGPVQGEKLTTMLVEKQLPWNKACAKKAITNLMPSVTLVGGMKLTAISPTAEELKKLKPVWAEECKKAGIDPAYPEAVTHDVTPGLESMGPIDVETLAVKPFKSDGSEANGSSIAFLAEYDGRTALLAGDGHPDVLFDGISSVCEARQIDKLNLDAFKLPHHGSKANINRELLEKVVCKRYLFSTNGAKFKHPDREAVARVIKFGGNAPELIFNYRTEFNEVWRDTNLMGRYRFSVSYPTSSGINISLS